MEVRHSLSAADLVQSTINTREALQNTFTLLFQTNTEYLDIFNSLVQLRKSNSKMDSAQVVEAALRACAKSENLTNDSLIKIRELLIKFINLDNLLLNTKDLFSRFNADDEVSSSNSWVKLFVEKQRNRYKIETDIETKQTHLKILEIFIYQIILSLDEKNHTAIPDQYFKAFEKRDKNLYFSDELEKIFSRLPNLNDVHQIKECLETDEHSNSENIQKAIACRDEILTIINRFKIFMQSYPYNNEPIEKTLTKLQSSSIAEDPTLLDTVNLIRQLHESEESIQKNLLRSYFQILISANPFEQADWKKFTKTLSECLTSYQKSVSEFSKKYLKDYEKLSEAENVLIGYIETFSDLNNRFKKFEEAYQEILDYLNKNAESLTFLIGPEKEEAFKLMEAANKKDEKPIERDQEPIERDQEPIEKDKKPIERDEKPIEKDEKPIEKDEKPIERDEKPIEKDEKPIERDEKPIERVQEPAEISLWRHWQKVIVGTICGGSVGGAISLTLNTLDPRSLAIFLSVGSGLGLLAGSAKSLVDHRSDLKKNGEKSIESGALLSHSIFPINYGSVKETPVRENSSVARLK